MDSYDIDLEDLDLKSVDINPSTNLTSPSNFKNVSFNSGSNSAFKPNTQNSYNTNNNPNLTISNSNNDPMPSFGGLSSDKEVDFGLNLLVNKKKQRPESEINKLGSNSNNPSPSFNSNSNNYNNNDIIWQF